MTRSKILYTETQRFSNWQLWVIIIGFIALIIYAIVNNYTAQQQLNNNCSRSSMILQTVIPLLIVIILIVFVFITKMNTAIGSDGVYVRYFPFHRRYKFFAWDDIQEAYIRKYKPVKEYGGWGLRRHKSFEVKFKSGKDIAYNVSGNMGLQLVLKNGKKILIGTRKPELVQEALEKVKNYQQIGKNI